MPCGWGCGAALGAREMIKHFASCPIRPGKQITREDVKQAIAKLPILGALPVGRKAKT